MHVRFQNSCKKSRKCMFNFKKHAKIGQKYMFNMKIDAKKSENALSILKFIQKRLHFQPQNSCKKRKRCINYVSDHPTSVVTFRSNRLLFAITLKYDICIIVHNRHSKILCLIDILKYRNVFCRLTGLA